MRTLYAVKMKEKTNEAQENSLGDFQIISLGFQNQSLLILNVISGEFVVFSFP